MNPQPPSEFQTNPNFLNAAIKELLFISGERQKAQRRVNAFFTKVPYSPELKQKIERDLPWNEIAPETCVEQRFAMFADYGWMKNLDLGRVVHPFDWRGADFLQATVRQLVLNLHELGLAPNGFLERSDELAVCRTSVARLSDGLSNYGLYGVWRNRHLGVITFPGEQPIIVAKRSELIFDTNRTGIPQPNRVFGLPMQEGESIEAINGLQSYLEGQIELQENGSRSLVPVRTSIFVYRDRPDLVLDSADGERDV